METKEMIQKTAIESLADRLQVSRAVLESTLKATAFRECKTNEEFVTCVIIANTYRLNPILKELYTFPAKGGGVVPIVSVDGWIKIVNNHPDSDGVELIENRMPDGSVESVTAKFYLKSKSHPIVVTEYMDECRMENREPWKKWPIRMLRHKAYIQGARVAFGFSGIYDEDEAERINLSVERETKGLKPIVQEPKALPKSLSPESQRSIAEGVDKDIVSAVAGEPKEREAGQEG